MVFQTQHAACQIIVHKCRKYRSFSVWSKSDHRAAGACINEETSTLILPNDPLIYIMASNGGGFGHSLDRNSTEKPGALLRLFKCRTNIIDPVISAHWIKQMGWVLILIVLV